MRVVRRLALFILIVGGAAVCFLTFGVSVSLLFSLFGPTSLLNEILGYISLAGPVPLLAGAVLLFFRSKQTLGAKLTLAGSFILSLYMVICYTRLDVYSVRILERMLWFGLIPLTVLAVDYASYRVYKLVHSAESFAQGATQSS
jgi:hypothetical protein